MVSNLTIKSLTRDELLTLFNKAEALGPYDWYQILLTGKTKYNEDTTLEEEWVNALLEGRKIVFFDKNVNKRNYRDLKGVIKGLEIAYNKCNESFNKFANNDIDDDFDCNDADNIIQCIIFGKIKYN